MSSDPGVHESRHPTLKQYVGIAIFLFIITIVEFVIILPEDFRGAGWTIAPLAILSAIKFAAVIFFYMHLKFDNRLLTWIFLGGLALGFAVVFALVALSSSWTPSLRPYAEANATPCTLNHDTGRCYEDEVGLATTTDHEPTAADSATATEPADTAPAAAATTPASGGLAATGRQVFITGAGEGAATPCVTCHTVEGVPEAVGLLGPDPVQHRRRGRRPQAGNLRRGLPGRVHPRAGSLHRRRDRTRHPRPDAHRHHRRPNRQRRGRPGRLPPGAAVTARLLPIALNPASSTNDTNQPPRQKSGRFRLSWPLSS